MIKIVFIFITLLFLNTLNAQDAKSSNTSSSGSGKFGLGLTLLGPTGITGKYLMNDKMSIEGSLGLGLLGYGRFHLHGVFLYNFYQINDSLSLYAGGGGVLQERGGRRDKEGNGRGRGNFFRDRDDNYENSLGIRAPLGISWKNADKKFELSAEVYVNVFLIGRDGVNAGLALAGRYYF
ncbi:MAG: hypothetical protein KBF99_17730 [Leptospiraceae bacterium]|nr:hypothetical protein [Leptospiraceae bacterium]MBL0263065.1 hypothetical protein [Leptospiraceae bacterium]MBP9165025.1 hypothetical protein [Leptospiraceae bacterium]